MSGVSERLKSLRKLMAERKIDILVVRSTDRYFNEYVSSSISTRAYITGFTGSVGDALISATEAVLVVDGRYTLQAKSQAVDYDVLVTSLGISIEATWLKQLGAWLGASTSPKAVGLESDRISQPLYEKVQALCKERGTIVLLDHSPVDDVRQLLGPPIVPKDSKIWEVSQELTGSTPQQRLRQLAPLLETAGLDAYLSVLLDEIAWLTNLRGNAFAYQATFPSCALVSAKQILVGLERLLDAPKLAGGPIAFTDMSELFSKARQSFGSSLLRIGYDPDQTSISLITQLKAAGFEAVPMNSPLSEAKTHKTPEELRHMRSAFARADRAVYKTQRWVCRQAKAHAISEADVDARIRQEFTKSGAWALSFKPICGAGKNAAVIHYGQPSNEPLVQEGSMFLLDTGALYEGGYATDLTRTFLVGKPGTRATQEQQYYFTLVLKGAIAGMSARFPKGTKGIQLDALVRAPLWQVGENYAHGTGHGVGINVHEFPPSVSTVSHTKLEPGHVFSIEPGIYLPGKLGIRIENLCTIVDDPIHQDSLRVMPLTFAPLDNRLIASKQLSAFEKRFLSWYRSQFSLRADQMPGLPPID